MISRKFLTLALMASLLSACGGDDDEAAIAPPPPAQSATGLWEGTLTITTGIAATRGVLAVVAPDGEYTATIAPTTGLNDGRILRGTGTVASQNQFTAGGTAYSAVAFPVGGGLTAAVTITGTVTTGTSITGTYSAGGETGTLTLTYRSLTNRPSSLTIAGGTYVALPGNTQPGTVNINGGVLDWSSTTCMGLGSLSVIDTTKNIYRWSMTVSAMGGACALANATPLQGLAYLAPNGSGTQDKVLVMHGTRALGAFVFIGDKP